MKDDPDVRFNKGHKSLVIEGKYDQNKGRLQKQHWKEETQTGGTSTKSTEWSNLSTGVPTDTPTARLLHRTSTESPWEVPWELP